MTLNRDHPRSRGEYPGSMAYPVGSYGSSPLSRGILCVSWRFCVSRRIIPALAGNTGAAVKPLVKAEDHPRSRGEYCTACSGRPGRLGSSPLSRGIRLPMTCITVLAGIIPALAGNTGTRQPAQESGADHPRSRGEYVTSQAPGLATMGSSPLSRGIPGSTGDLRLPGGIIPALAGNTGSACRQGCDDADHPRSRGEYAPHGHALFLREGSSPLSRGILGAHHGALLRPGIIPALAGNTAP